MLPKKKMQDIFEDDPFGLLNVKPAAIPARNADERLVASFQEVLEFYEKNNREPEQGNGIQEHQLYSRLRGIRENPEKVEMLQSLDKYGLLNYEQKQVSSINDIFGDDQFGILENTDEGLYDLKHISKQDEKASADFVARRKPCKNFSEYEPKFKEVQKDLASRKRKLIVFKQDNLRAGDFYVHNGVLLLLETVDFEEEVQEYKSGSRVRKDGRTRVVFENGTESNMLYRSLYKSLLANGQAVSENQDRVSEEFAEKFNMVNEDDVEAGYIYILKSKSEKEEIRTIQHLYKIGYSKIAVEERIKNASQEPTYLMANVRIVMAYKCYNMNPQKFEQLIHNFFGTACLNVDVFDGAGNRYTPREWFIAPLNIIEEVIQLIINGKIVDYRYDVDNSEIVSR
jgi:T5orf172 domain